MAIRDPQICHALIPVATGGEGRGEVNELDSTFLHSDESDGEPNTICVHFRRDDIHYEIT